MATEIKPLTSIRGIAAVLVAVYHFHQNQDTGWAVLNRFIAHGYLWVDLFFVLSGFVMAMTYAEMFATGFNWESYRGFLSKRIARVYPLYLFITLGVSAYSLLVYGGFSEVHRPAVHLDQPVLAHITNLLMVQAWGFGSSIGGPTWSISTEWAAYLLFPMLVQLALFKRWQAASGLLLGAMMLLVFVATQPETGETVRNGQFDIYHCKDLMAVMRCVGGFSIGLLAFRLTRSATVMRVLSRDAICAGLFALLIVLMASGIEDLWIYPVLPLLVIGLYAVKGWASRVVSAWPFYQLGVLSYSIYLLHLHLHVVLEQLQKRLPHFVGETYSSIAAPALVYGILLGLAVLLYHFVEKPGRTWLNQIMSGPKRPITVVAPQAEG